MKKSIPQKLKILFSHYSAKDRDGFSRNFMFARELAAKGHDVTLLTSQDDDFIFPHHCEIRDGVRIVAFPEIGPRKLRRLGFGVLNIVLRSIYCLRHRFDIVQTDNGHRPASGWPCRLNRLFYRSKYISEWWDYFHKGGLYDEKPWLQRHTIQEFEIRAEVRNKKIADGIVALSQFTHNRALGYGIEPQRVCIIQGGADIDFIQYHPTTVNKLKFGIPEESFTFGFIGMSDSEFKDLLPFLEAVANLRDRIEINWFTTGLKLTPAIKHQYNIGPELIELGWIDYADYSDLLSCADVFVLLLQDNLVNKARWPNKLGDYLAAGRLILTNPVGEICELLPRYPHSFVCAEWNKTSVEAAILELHRRQADLCTIGEISREIAEKDLSWHIQAQKLETFYYQILNQKPHSADASRGDVTPNPLKKTATA